LAVARAFQVTRIKVECFREERFVKAHRVNPTNFLTELKRRNVLSKWQLSSNSSQFRRRSRG
jgi:hypothetical protein